MAAQTYHQRIREEKRQGCVRAARALFLAQGYERTSLAEVARAANLSTATLFKRYPTKAALFAAVVEATRPMPGPDRTDDPEDAEAALLALGHAYAQALADPDVAGVHRLIIAEASVFPDLGRVLNEQADGPVVSRIEAVLARAGQEDAAERAGTARAVLAIIAREVLWPQLTEPARPTNRTALDAVVRRAATMALATVSVAPGFAEARRATRGGNPASVRRDTVRRREHNRQEDAPSLFAFD